MTGEIFWNLFNNLKIVKFHYDTWIHHFFMVNPSFITILGFTMKKCYQISTIKQAQNWSSGSWDSILNFKNKSIATWASKYIYDIYELWSVTADCFAVSVEFKQDISVCHKLTTATLIWHIQGYIECTSLIWQSNNNVCNAFVLSFVEQLKDAIHSARVGGVV